MVLGEVSDMWVVDAIEMSMVYSRLSIHYQKWIEDTLNTSINVSIKDFINLGWNKKFSSDLYLKIH